MTTDYEDANTQLLREIRDILAAAFEVQYYCPKLWVDGNGEPCEPEAQGSVLICPGGVELRQHSREYWKSDDDRDKLYHPLPEDRHYTGPGVGGPTEIRNHNVWRSKALRATQLDEGGAPTRKEGSSNASEATPARSEARDEAAATPPSSHTEPRVGWTHGEQVAVTPPYRDAYEQRLRPLLNKLAGSYGGDLTELWSDWGEHRLMAQIRATNDSIVVTPGSLSLEELDELAGDVQAALEAASAPTGGA